MSEAPERIWAISDRRRNWTDEKQAGPSECHSIEYIRADVSDALVAAAVDACVEAYASGFEWDYFSGTEDVIRKVTPTDARAALDRIRQEARQQALREAMIALSQGPVGDGKLRERSAAIADLITKDKTDG